MPKKLTCEYVKSQFEKYGYIPKFTEYINAHTKLDYICPNGHEHSITWSDFNNGQRCPHCAGNAKLSYEFVKEYFEKDGYIPKFTEYINNNTKLDYVCPEGHKGAIKYAHWKDGHRCGICANKSTITIEFIKQYFVKQDYICSSTKYINAHTKLDYICPNEHRHSISWNEWSSGNRCPYCAINAKLTLGFIKQEFAKEGCTVLDDIYINNKTKINYICQSGHEHSITWDAWKAGKRCPKCSNNGTSNFEKEVKQFIIDQGIDIIENDRTTILNHNTNCFLELDILFPCKTKAIECNGIYWHDRPEAIERDKIKNKQCKKLGIDLLTITDEEWIYNQKSCKDKIIKFVL